MMTSSFSPRSPRSARRSRSDVVATSPRGERRSWQIGPRIRVGGSVGHAAQKLKIGAGKVLSNKYVDIGLSLIPGVGPGLAAAANATGHVLDTSHGGIHSAGDVGRMALDAGETYLGAKGANIAKDAIVKHGVKGAIKLGVTKAIGSHSAPGADGATDGGSSSGGIVDKAKSIFTGGGSDGQGDFGYLGDLAGKFGGGGGGDMAKKALMLAMIADAAKRHQEQRGFQNKALDIGQQHYDAMKPVRDQGLSLVQSQQTPDLSSIFGNSANPYARQATPFNVSAKTPILPSSGSY